MEIRVELGSRSYPIVIAPGLLAHDPLARVRASCAPSKVYVVTDENIAPVYGVSFGGLEPIVLPAGEATKSFTHFQWLSEELLARGVDRRTVLVALGGGVVGDLVGFVAATLLRGISYVQVPTTLLAQVDSSVGGKTAIDTPQGKNLVGAFHQPRLVMIDPVTLSTLPARQMRAGYAEIVKYGLIRDRAFFDWLVTNGRSLLSGDIDLQSHAIATSCRAKAAIVAEDETEQGARALLNLGHTFAHALESVGGYREDVLHGEAVAVGMCLAFRLSARLGLCQATETDQLESHLRDLGLPTRLAEFAGLPPTPEPYLAAMQADKKTLDSKLVFILVRGIGEAFVARDVPVAIAQSIVAESLAPR